MNYLAQLKQSPSPALPPGALPPKTLFSRAYNSLLSHRRRFSSIGTPAKPLYDGKPLDLNILVELCELCAEDGVACGIGLVRQAATALAALNPADDPWVPALEALLANPALGERGRTEGPIAKITIHGVPHWFVTMRDLKSELNAYGAPACRRVRLAMRSLGWRERRALVWGRRLPGFSRIQ
jgi:hypothetical protein